MALDMPLRQKLFWFIGILTLFRLTVAATLELSFDEGYYWLWSKNLELSYFDHPPMVAYVLALTTFFSDAEIFVRLAPILSAALTSWLLYSLARELYGDELAGFNAALIANVTLIFSVGAFIATPDTPLIPFYLGGMLLMSKAVKSDPGGRESYLLWSAAGAAVGGAMLSKYTALFFFPCAFLYLLFSARQRRWLARPEPYIAAALSAVAFTPVILWNSRHGWVSFWFQGSHGLAGGGGGSLDRFLEFAGLQVILYSVGIFFFLVAAGVALTRSSFKEAIPARRDTALFLFSFSVPILAFFFLNSFRARMEGNWPILGFLPLFLHAGRMASAWYGSPRTKVAFRASLAFALILWGLFHVQVTDPIIPHPQRHEISRRVYGWKLLGSRIDEVRKKEEVSFLISNRHQITTLMTYYTTPNITAYVTGTNNRRFPFLPPPDSFVGKNAIYLTEMGRDRIKQIETLFDGVKPLGTVEIVRKGELIRRFTLYLCYNYRGGLDGV